MQKWSLMRRNKSVYHNPKQIAFLKARQKFRVNVWGRGSGKSTAIASINYIKMRYLPRAKVFFSSSTYNQILTKTLPPIEAMWSTLGLKENLHFVVGRRPPKNFNRPYAPPRKYENVVTFFNGYTIEFLSMDRPDLARGGSYDGGDIDEAGLVPQDRLNRVLLPSIRGNRNRFSHWLHHNKNLYSSMPWKSTGQYLLDYAEKAVAYPDLYFYSEATAEDNLVVLGKEGIAELRRELTHEEFMVEVMNQPLRRVPDGFYPHFNEKQHTYAPEYVYGEGKRGVTVEGAKDVNTKAMLEVALDFGGWFSCASVWQEDLGVERCINTFHVKEDGTLNDLVDAICGEYAGHKFRRVRVWGEPRGHDKSATGDTVYDQVARRFRYNGWYVEVRAPRGYRGSAHEQRHYFLNDILSEQYLHLPKVRINEETCRDMIYAIMMTSIKPDFKKDKSKERDRTYPQEHAPHYTDGLDYYFMQKYFSKAKQHGMKLDDPVVFS